MKAVDVRTTEQRDKLLAEGLATVNFSRVRLSPQFHKNTLSELKAMIRQLGLPTYFITLSANDIYWTHVRKALLYVKLGRPPTDEELTDLIPEQACELVRDDPVTSARYWDYLCRGFIDDILKRYKDIMGGFTDSYDVYESQKRGTFHSHGLYWQEGAPIYSPETEREFLDYHDQYICCRFVQNAILFLLDVLDD